MYIIIFKIQKISTSKKKKIKVLHNTEIQKQSLFIYLNSLFPMDMFRNIIHESRIMLHTMFCMKPALLHSVLYREHLCLLRLAFHLWQEAGSKNGNCIAWICTRNRLILQKAVLDYIPTNVLRMHISRHDHWFFL